jgi:hypothetical protein
MIKEWTKNVSGSVTEYQASYSTLVRPLSLATITERFANWNQDTKELKKWNEAQRKISNTYIHPRLSEQGCNVARNMHIYIRKDRCKIKSNRTWIARTANWAYSSASARRCCLVDFWFAFGRELFLLLDGFCTLGDGGGESSSDSDATVPTAA